MRGWSPTRTTNSPSQEVGEGGLAVDRHTLVKLHFARWLFHSSIPQTHVRLRIALSAHGITRNKPHERELSGVLSASAIGP